MINKSKVKEQIKKYSKRNSISDDVLEYLDVIYFHLLHAIIKMDNMEITPNSKKTLVKSDIEKAINIFSEEYGLIEFTDIETADGKIKPGKILLDNEEIDINLNLTIDLKNQEILANISD